MDFTSDAKMICEAISALATSSATTTDVFGNYNDHKITCFYHHYLLDISVLFQTM